MGWIDRDMPRHVDGLQLKTARLDGEPFLSLSPAGEVVKLIRSPDLFGHMVTVAAAECSRHTMVGMIK